MADTYSQIHIQYVFSVKNRECLLLPDWRDRLFEYMTGIVRQKGQKPIIVGGYLDHIHLFIGLRPNMAISDLIRDIKNCSSNFINENKFTKSGFAWQEGYGAFSYSKSHVHNVYNYIKNQEAHHRKKTFKEEYIEFLEAFEIEFDERYLFKWI